MVQYPERVSIIVGKKPAIYVAPHGAHCDDVNTALIAEILAESTNGYAVINRGWERADEIHYKKEKANCNNVEHCHKDVIKEEFLDPLFRFKNRILKKWARVAIIYLHGMSNNIQSTSGIDDLNYVVGWGSGKPPSHTCQKWIKDFVIYHLSIGDNCTVGEGKAGGNYAAWSRKNMTQLFRKWYPDSEVDSLQIEIINKLRNTKLLAETTAQIMAITFEEMLATDSQWALPSNYIIPKI
jgi:hypothetical protein